MTACPVIPAVDGEVRPHDATPDKSFLLILYVIHQRPSLRVKGHKVGHHRRIIHQGDLEHSAFLIGYDGIIDRDAVDGNYGHIFFS